MREKRQILGLVLAFLVLASFLMPPAQNYYYLQERHRVSVGASLDILRNWPASLNHGINVYIKEGAASKGPFALDRQAVVKEPGQVKLELKLFGFIPLKEINVDVLPNIQLVPGGQSIGVLLRTDGVMVVGYSPVLNQNNQPVFPAREADVNIGDTIIEVNGIKVASDDQVKTIIASVNDPKAGVNMLIKRDNKLIQRTVYPQYCHDTKSYRIGLFIRDNAGGVGTLTFYDPQSKKYGALGHVIADAETNQKLQIKQGKILCASVEDIQIAKRGDPGEKVGVFMENSDLGTIEKNDSCGIYGVLNKDLQNPLYPNPLPIAYSSQVHTGEAEFLTVIKGQEIQKYKINIDKLMYGRADGKNMIIRITDQELLKKTGGIVQGMSGSPILQDGKIVGAVTHVFVNDPARGYGVFIENMLMETGILKDQKQTLGFNSQGLFINILN